MMYTYLVMLLVTVEQEQAIKFLYEQRGWKYFKTGSRMAVKEELEMIRDTLLNEKPQESVIKNLHPYVPLDYLENTATQQLSSVAAFGRNLLTPFSVHDLSRTSQLFTGLDSTSLFSGELDLHVTPASSTSVLSYEGAPTVDNMNCISKSLIILDNMGSTQYTNHDDAINDSTINNCDSVTTVGNASIQTTVQTTGQAVSTQDSQDTVDSVEFVTPAAKIFHEETTSAIDVFENQDHMPHSVILTSSKEHSSHTFKASDSEAVGSIEYVKRELPDTVLTQQLNSPEPVEITLLNSIMKVVKEILHTVNSLSGKHVNTEEIQNQARNLIVDEIQNSFCRTVNQNSENLIEIVNINRWIENIKNGAQNSLHESFGSVKDETLTANIEAQYPSGNSLFPSLSQTTASINKGSEENECFHKDVELCSISDEKDFLRKTIESTVNSREIQDTSTLESCYSKVKLSNNDPESEVRKDNLGPTRNKIQKIRKYHWAVNRNIRIHRCHRKCRKIPSDLDVNNYSMEEKGYYCRDCQFVFNTKKQVRSHRDMKGGHCSLDCIYCDKDNFKETFDCAKCPKTFKSIKALKRHVEKHVSTFHCHFCGDSFYTTQELKSHVQSSHTEESQVIYLCDLCGSKFNERKVLNAHRKYVHTNERPEVCPTCGNRFKTKSQLRNHLVSHKKAEELNLSCEICGKMFLRVATLKDHVRRHNKEFSLFCSVCSKGFYKKFDLEEHARSHTGIKPYECKICTYKCSLKCNLVKHMKIHMRQKSFQIS